MKPLRLLILAAAIGVLAVDGAGAQPMQITPPVARPMSRTSLSWNRMLIPSLVARTMSLFPSVS